MAVPIAFQDRINRLRRYLKDTPTLNILWEAREMSDDELYELMDDATVEANTGQEPMTSWTINTINWVLLRRGSVLAYLTSAGIHSARNTLTWNDPSGINLRDTDVWGRYINYYNVLLNKYERLLLNIKRNLNIQAAYGEVDSEFQDIGGDYAEVNSGF